MEANVKRDYYKHSTNPLAVPLKKEHHPVQTTQQDQLQFKTNESITFNIGSDDTPPPIIKKQQYKHPTPPDATSQKHGEDIKDTNVPQNIQPSETKTRRILRSNSTIIEKNKN